MVKPRPDPTISVMAVVASGGELTLVIVVFLVTADAGRRGLAVRFTGLMAGLAPESAVCAGQRKIGALMVELRDIQAHDISISSEVLGVTADAPARACVGHTAVIALVLPEVGSDGLVAIKAQRALPRSIRSIVAIAADCLQFGVRRGQRTGHEQALHRGGICARGP